MIKKLLLTCLMGALSTTYACTDFMLVANDKNVVVGRSLEFGIDLHSKLAYRPIGERFESILDNKKKGFSWVAKHAFLGVTAFSDEIIFDGLNDSGLSVELLWMPDAQYPSLTAQDIPQNTIPLELIASWVLSSFQSTDEVKAALPKISIWAHPIEGLGSVPPVHFAIHDRQGHSLVVEFIAGVLTIQDNLVGVLTNSPEFAWHKTNLRNYINLSAVNAAPLNLNGSVLEPTGQGTGLLGIPGDWTSPSRFVRIAIMKECVQQAKNGAENMNLARHLLNSVDIPYGAIRPENGRDFDYTQWVVVKNLSTGDVSYRRYSDAGFKSVTLSDFVEKLTESKIFTLEEKIW